MVASYHLPGAIHNIKHDTQKNRHLVHSDTVTDILDDLDVESLSKVLVAAHSSNILRNMLVETDILPQLAERGYNRITHTKC